MNLGLQNIEDYTKDLHWMLQATMQLEKEFYQQGWIFDKPIQADNAFEFIEQQLLPKLSNEMAQKGNSYSKQLLYKIDIEESQIARAAIESQGSSFLEILTKLIIMRCLQKVLIRNYYKHNEKDAIDKLLEE
jgi:hypothetical protein